MDLMAIEKSLNVKLIEITLEELVKLRMGSFPFLVLKNDGKFYFSEVERNFNPSFDSIGIHMCSYGSTVCHRLSAATDENGGCAKVRDRLGIEMYPWISDGIETVNTQNDSFIVLSCLHHQISDSRKKYTDTEKNRLRLSIAQYVWPEFDTLKEVRDHYRKIHSIG